MAKKVNSVTLIGLGMLAGIAAATQLSALAQRFPGAPLPLAELRQLSDVFGLIKSEYVEKVDDKKLVTDAISGMVASLDPHSVYLDKTAYQEMRESMQGKFVGIGIEVAIEEGYIRVVAPIEDSPAAKAGIKAGDLITRFDDVPLKGMTLDQSIKRMRGQPHSRVVLTVTRKGEDKPLTFAIVREEIRVQSVKVKMVEPGYAWVRIAQFQEPTLDDMVRKLGALYAEEPNIKGLVLDLRNDPGGLVPGAIGVSAAFLPKDVVVVSTNGQVADSKKTFYARREFYSGRQTGDALARAPEALKKVPLVVLVNTGSASASEIVAGALQDYKRATIIGSQTFGKGSVQTLRQITPDTAVKLTTARYYTPLGRSIQAKGIVPDLLVDEGAGGDGWNTLRVREADLEKHLATGEALAGVVTVTPPPPLTSPAAAPAPAPVLRNALAREHSLIAAEKKRKPVDFGSKDDFQLSQALNHFKGLPVQLARLAGAPEEIGSKQEVKADIQPEDRKSPASK